jgi:hypothetical protein
MIEMKNLFGILVIILLTVISTFEVLNYFKKDNGVSDNSKKVVDVAYSELKHDITDSLGNRGLVIEFLADCKVVLVDTIWYCTSNDVVVEKTTNKTLEKKTPPKDNFGGPGPDSVKDDDTTKFRSIEIIKEKEVPKDTTPVSSIIIIQNNYNNNNCCGENDEPKLEPYVFKEKNTVWPAIFGGTGAVIFGLNEVGIRVKGWHGDKNFLDQPLKLEFDKKYTNSNIRKASIAMMGVGFGFEAWNLWRNYKGKKGGGIKPLANENGMGLAFPLNSIKNKIKI